jgi:type IV pilus assembly protein PilM
MSQYQLVYRVVEKIKEEKQLKLTVYAVPNTLIDSYLTMAKALELQLVAIDYYGNSIYQAMMHSINADIAATICIEDTSSMITVVDKGNVILQRSIGYGIDEAVKTMMESTLVKRGTTYLQALTQMQMNPSFSETLHGRSEEEREATGAKEKSTKEKITESLTMLVGNLSRVLDYFASRNPDVELSTIYLVGLGADCIGLDLLLTNELGINVETIRRFGTTDVARELSAQRFHLGEYYGCIGTAIEPLNFIFAVEEEKAANESLTVALTVCIGGVLVAVALVFVGTLSNLLVQSDIRSLEDTISAKESAVDVYNNYVTQTTICNELENMDTLSVSSNSAFLSLLSQMEEKMPSDIMVSNLAASDDGISMTMTTTSKESAAEVLEQFRTFDGIGNIVCTGVTESIDEDGNKVESFQVSLNYVETQEEATEEAQE